MKSKLQSDFPHIYFMMNKPFGAVCSRVSDRRTTVYQLLPEEIKNLPNYEKLHTAGRLDAETEGLLIFTTDGYFSNYLTRPETHVSKTYRAVLETSVSLENQKIYIQKLREGIFLPPEKKGEAFTTKPAELIFEDEKTAVVTVCEGKFHQVRRMFQYFENPVVKLERITFGDYSLPLNLNSGEITMITVPDDLLKKLDKLR